MGEKIVLIRHATTGDDFHGSFVGSTDVPLSRRGFRQAARLSDILQDMGQCTYISSPMKRAIETVRNAVQPGIHFGLDPDLREIDFGAFEGLTFEEINSRYPKQVNEWTGLKRDFVFPHGESIAGFLGRIRRVGSRMASLESKTVVAFTHGGVIVTKDSGVEGGVPQKIEAARLEGCLVIMVRRPDATDVIQENVFDNIPALISSVRAYLS